MCRIVFVRGKGFAVRVLGVLSPVCPWILCLSKVGGVWCVYGLGFRFRV